MLKTLQTRLKRAGRWLPVVLLPLLPFAAQAQNLNYAASNSVNAVGTYTDLGTTGAAITTANTDDANSAAQAIGFTFSFNGATFTQFVLNTNGFIKLGAAAPSATAMFLPESATATNSDPISSTSAADINILAPFNFDLTAGSATGGTEYRVVTTGTAPNRVCTIQWKNVADKTLVYDLQYSSMNFQAKLYETTNNIEFVFGATTQGPNADDYRFAIMGIKGSGSANGQTVLVNKPGTGTTAWSTAVFITGFYTATTLAFDYRGTVRADVGRTYRFVPGVVAGPTNDDCTGATALTVSSSCTVVTSTNAAASASTAPTPSCFTTPVSNDVWFTAVVPSNGTLTVTTSAITGSALNDTGLTIYSGTCTGLTEIGCNDDISSSNFFSSATVTGRTAGSTVYVRVWSYNTSPTGQFGICATTPTPIDAAVSQVYTLTKLPIPQGAPHMVKALLTNAGTTALTSFPVTLNITGANAFTNTQTVASLAVGASTTVTFAAFVPTVAGTNTVTVTAAATGDANAANNSVAVSQAVNASTYSYSDASAPTSARGFGPSTTVVNSFAVKYTANTSVSITQVRALLVDFVGTGAGSTIGKTVYAVVLNPTTGAVLGRSPDYVVAAADVTGTAYTAFTLSTPMAAPVGDFLVGIAQTYQAGQTTQYFPVATQAELPTARVGAYYTASISTPATPTDITTTATTANPAVYRFMIEAVTTSTSAPACTPVSNVAASAITQTGATISFSAPAGTSAYTVTYTPAGGTATTVTPAPTASPFTLTGLNSGTTYTVSIVASCTAGANSIPVTTTFTTLVPAPTYATLPYAQDFEAWINVASTSDVPSNNWRNTPATGNNSWRREDQGFSTASWFYQTAETSANPPYPIRFSTGAHSARFHTYGANNGDQGKLDLYVNLSTAGTKTLTFDYINPTGLDKLEVFLSTDGGATFGTTPLLTATTNTAFTAKAVSLTSTSATAVLRFQATADNLGNDDIGIDNLRLSVGTATRDQALAASVSLFPNPAHHSFELRVPAGPLGGATATLRNALGQTVLTRPLGLPAGGGTTAFEVSQLAPGLYSLTLQAGQALVVKQVVVQ